MFKWPNELISCFHVITRLVKRRRRQRRSPHFSPVLPSPPSTAFLSACVPRWSPTCPYHHHVWDLGTPRNPHYSAEKREFTASRGNGAACCKKFASCALLTSLLSSDCSVPWWASLIHLLEWENYDFLSHHWISSQQHQLVRDYRKGKRTGRECIFTARHKSCCVAKDRDGCVGV